MHFLKTQKLILKLCSNIYVFVITHILRRVSSRDSLLKARSPFVLDPVACLVPKSKYIGKIGGELRRCSIIRRFRHWLHDDQTLISSLC